MTSSALLIPTVTTGLADATLAYRTDTIPEAEKIDVLPIGVEAVLAIQPIAIARSSDHKELARRLKRAILDSQESFEAAGFNWRGGGEGFLK
jgi:ABC-type molybdate transport system substrate-binding protein